MTYIKTFLSVFLCSFCSCAQIIGIEDLPPLPVCGDGVVERDKGEICDDANTVSGDGCSENCRILERCGNGLLDPGEVCDPTAPDSGPCNDDCGPLASCGDGVADLEEDCDEGIDGIRRSTPTCDDNCTVPWCGDGDFNSRYVNPATGRPEECDEGENTATCDADCTMPACGDHVVNPAAGEECDDDNTSMGDGCFECQTECGNSVRDPGEQCDDGNDDNQDECVADCRIAFCGDTFVRSGAEECDDGNDSNGDACVEACENARCGDGFVYLGVEACDDGNASNTDGCPDGSGGTCQLARCGDGFRRSSGAEIEDCDDGDGNNNDDCPDGTNGTCENARCGDGFVRAGVEECDDGNSIDNDACPNDCTIP